MRHNLYFLDKMLYLYLYVYVFIIRTIYDTVQLKLC